MAFNWLPPEGGDNHVGRLDYAINGVPTRVRAGVIARAVGDKSCALIADSRQHTDAARIAALFFATKRDCAFRDLHGKDARIGKPPGRCLKN